MFTRGETIHLGKFSKTSMIKETVKMKMMVFCARYLVEHPGTGKQCSYKQFSLYEMTRTQMFIVCLKLHLRSSAGSLLALQRDNATL